MHRVSIGRVSMVYDYSRNEQGGVQVTLVPSVSYLIDAPIFDEEGVEIGWAVNPEITPEGVVSYEIGDDIEHLLWRIDANGQVECLHTVTREQWEAVFHHRQPLMLP